MELERENKTTITKELTNGATMELKVDHLDDEDSFRLSIGEKELGWMNKDCLNQIVKVINKAKSIQ